MQCTQYIGMCKNVHKFVYCINSTRDRVCFQCIPFYLQGEFNWNSNTQGLVLGAFFYGYIITQIPGGWLAEVFGGKKLFGFGVLCTAILTLLTPLAARWNLYVFIALRVIEGIGEVIETLCLIRLEGVYCLDHHVLNTDTLIYICKVDSHLTHDKNINNYIN